MARDSYEGLEHADAWPTRDVHMQPVVGGRVVHKQRAGRGQHLRAVGRDELAVLELRLVARGRKKCLTQSAHAGFT